MHQMWGTAPVVALLLLASTASAADPLEVEARVESMGLQGVSTLQVKTGLFRADPSPGTEFAFDDPSGVTVEQYWRNATVITNPLVGDTLYRRDEPMGHVTWSEAPRALRLQTLNAEPGEVYLALASSVGMVLAGDGALELAVGADGQPWDPPQVVVGKTPRHPEFAKPAEHSGRARLAPERIDGPGYLHLLVDGWVVQTTDGRDARVTRTGSAQEANRVVYTYLVFNVTQPAMDWGAVPLNGLAPAPFVEWTGVSRTDVYVGELTVDGDRRGLSRERLDLEGTFGALLEFNQDASSLGALFHAVGQGSIVRAAAAAAPEPPGFPLGRVVGTTLATLALAGAALTAWCRFVRPQARPALVDLLRQVRDHPLEADGHLALGAALLESGHPEPGLRALDRAFRLHPASVMRVLEDPRLATVREHSDVRRLLARIHRDNHRRHWAGYA